MPSNGCGSRSAASISPSSTIRDGATPNPAATRSAVPNRLASTGIFAPARGLEHQGRSAGCENAAVNLGHFMNEADRLADSRQKTAIFEEADEGAKVAKSRKVAERHSALVPYSDVKPH